ncbi:MAG: biotin/lipoyl-binding protein, partial [Maribacter sp.]|uniref:biotin/lipoyl-binding protein n=1 Tax=Maribacter sp. TaxID=1897614 RepID=UPI003C718B4E
MNVYRNLFISCITMVALNSCGNDTLITPYRGKVKFETISVSSKLAGRISKIYVEEGQAAKKGDTLALLDIPEIHAKMMQAEGAVTAAKGQLDMAFNGATAEQVNQITGQIDAGRAQLDFAQQSYNRLQ